MKRDMFEVLLEAMLSGNSGEASVNQEKRGQQDLVHNDVIPLECPREELEALGFSFGDMVDDLFIAVTMPKGWAKRQHSIRCGQNY